MPAPKDLTKYKQWKKKLSISHKGKIPYMKGKKHTKESKKKMSESAKYRPTRVYKEINGDLAYQLYVIWGFSIADTARFHSLVDIKVSSEPIEAFLNKKKLIRSLKDSHRQHWKKIMDENEVKKLYEKELVPTEISTIYGCSRSTIYNILKNKNAKIRSQSDATKIAYKRGRMKAPEYFYRKDQPIYVRLKLKKFANSSEGKEMRRNLAKRFYKSYEGKKQREYKSILMTEKWNKGWFPFNKSKKKRYKGDITHSEWEYVRLKVLEPFYNVKKCKITIPYKYKGNRNYTPDIEIYDKITKNIVGLEEIKPQRLLRKKRNSTYGNKTLEIIAKNQAKINAGRKFCKEKGIFFNVVTEKNLPVIPKLKNS